MTTPTERAFAFFERGEVRDQILSEFRIGLRLLINPETGATFTEDEIARATQRGSRFWREANAIDLVGMAKQSRGLWLADQVRPERASSSWLYGYHGELWGTGDPLPANPGSGPATALADPGTIFIGSTTIPDPAAHTARDAAGLHYQVLTTVVTPVNGIALLTIVGIDTGPDTNLPAGSELTWDAPPIGAQPKFVTNVTFTGGLPRETASEYSSRLRARIRHKQGAGNNSQVRSWTRDASNAVLDAYVYSCAMHAGSTLVCVTQKRGSTTGPFALIANPATIAAATAYITPPASPVFPTRAFVLVVPALPQPTDTVVQLAQGKGSSAGWRDVTPWPGLSTTVASIGTVTDQQHFRMHSDTALPGGAGSLSGVQAPHIMVWNFLLSRFESLVVTSITSVGGDNYDVVLATPASTPFAPGAWISPDMARRLPLAVAVEGYFDSLGPGEVVDLATDTRADRAGRFPDPSEEAPARGGQAIITAIADGLGASLSEGSLFSMSAPNPIVPADPTTGPSKLTILRFAVYELS